MRSRPSPTAPTDSDARFENALAFSATAVAAEALSALAPLSCDAMWLAALIALCSADELAASEAKAD